MTAGINPRLMVLGNARHGKDTVCEILRDVHGLKFTSSSHFVAERAVRPWLAAKGIVYASFEDMYADRVNHRKAWHDAIAAYNVPDPCKLAKELYTKFDIYCGIRSRLELDALKKEKVVQFTFFVDALKRLPGESADSMKLSLADADYVIDNNGPLTDLPAKVERAYATARRVIAERRRDEKISA